MSPTATRPKPAGLSLSGPGPLLMVFGLLILAGVVVVVLAWHRAAGTDLVPYQVPAGLASMVGLALVGVGLSVYDVHSGRRQEADEVERLDGLTEEVGRLARALTGRVVRDD